MPIGKDILQIRELLQIRERIEEMFNTYQVGKRIAQLRKQRNMTQLELADRLSISYQAVSNWERGNSMPDISKLPELADILQVSLDELLGEKSPLLESVLEDRVEEYASENEVEKKELENVLPLLKPEQAANMAEDMEIQNEKLNFSKIGQFLPYLSEEKVNELAERAQAQGEGFEQFLPFMSEQKIAELCGQALEMGESIAEYLPFLSGEAISSLCMKAYEMGEDVGAYLPFMEEKMLDKLALRAAEDGGDISGFLPFLSEEGVEALMMRELMKK